jgi:hypothetical protein
MRYVEMSNSANQFLEVNNTDDAISDGSDSIKS